MNEKKKTDKLPNYAHFTRMGFLHSHHPHWALSLASLIFVSVQKWWPQEQPKTDGPSSPNLTSPQTGSPRRKNLYSSRYAYRIQRRSWLVFSSHVHLLPNHFSAFWCLLSASTSPWWPSKESIHYSTKLVPETECLYCPQIHVET